MPQKLYIVYHIGQRKYQLLIKSCKFPFLCYSNQYYSLDNLYRLDVAFSTFFMFSRALEVGNLRREKAYLGFPTQASLHGTPLECSRF